LGIVAGDPVAAAVEAHCDAIRQETLAVELSREALAGAEKTAQVEVEATTVDLSVARVQ
jgi:hypothetical protein